MSRRNGPRRAATWAPVAVTLEEARQPERALRVRVGRPAGSPPAPPSEGTADGQGQGTGPAPAAARRLPSQVPDEDPAAFDGPLALLLALIEARRLDVLTVPLGELAGAYLEAMGELAADRLPYLSAFVAVAAQLILIKSRALLPSEPAPEPAGSDDEGPDPEAELRRRLIVYRAYRDAGAWLRDHAQAGPLVRREPAAALAAGLAGARPPAEPPLDPAVLGAALQRTVRLVGPAQPPPDVVRRTITLGERAEAIRAAIRRAPVLVLQDLLAGTRDRVLAAITFLAMLELVKRREIAVEQDRPWGPIRCRALEPAGGRDGTDQPPIDESLEDFA